MSSPRRNSIGSWLERLPAEIIQHVFSFLSPIELVRAGATCHRLQQHSLAESLWSALLAQHVHRRITLPSQYSSYRTLFASFFPFWFLTQHKIWFSDASAEGDLLLFRYSPGRDCIEAYSLEAHHRSGVEATTSWEWEWDPEVTIDSFEPVIKMNLDAPVLKLSANALATLMEKFKAGSGRDSLLQDEDEPAEVKNDIYKLSLEVPIDSPDRQELPFQHAPGVGLLGMGDFTSRLNFMFTRALPSNGVERGVALWPPLIVPSPTPQLMSDSHGAGGLHGCRTRNTSSDGFRGLGHKPSTWATVNEAGFRLRTWIQLFDRDVLQFGMLGRILGGFNVRTTTANTRLPNRIAEKITTYGTIDARAYTPTAAKPYRGIWAGDYVTHGVEFLLLLQPDEEELQHNRRPLPESAKQLIDAVNGRERRRKLKERRARLAERASPDLSRQSSLSSETYSTTGVSRRAKVLCSVDAALRFGVQGFEVDTSALARFPEEDLTDVSAAEHLPDDGEHQMLQSERIEIVKLTGDPNVPLGQYTCIAEDIGPRGLVRIAHEESFEGARIVRSVGHVAASGFREAGYTETELILISPDLLAQYWKAFGRISFYERVNIDDYLHAD